LAESGASQIGWLAASINLPKVVYYPGEPINLALVGLEGREKDVTLIISEPLDPDGEGSAKVIPSDDHPKLRAPETSGTYEVRLYSGHGTPKAGDLLAKASIMVTGRASGAFKVETDGTLFKPGDRVTVKVSGVTPTLIENGAMVGVFPKGAKVDGFTFSISVSAPEEELFLDLPWTGGLYEIRAHAADGPLTDEGLVAVIPIEVR
jgi:hypothetical protein